MTKPNKRRFQSVRVISIDPTSKTEHTDFDPTLLSSADLEKICRSVDGIRAAVMLEFARRAGYIRQEPILWLEPTGRQVYGASSSDSKKIKGINLKELEELAAEL